MCLLHARCNEVAIGKMSALAQQIGECHFDLPVLGSAAGEMGRELRDEQCRLGTSERGDRMLLGQKPEVSTVPPTTMDSISALTARILASFRWMF